MHSTPGFNIPQHALFWLGPTSQRQVAGEGDTETESYTQDHVKRSFWNVDANTGWILSETMDDAMIFKKPNWVRTWCFNHKNVVSQRRNSWKARDPEYFLALGSWFNLAKLLNWKSSSIGDVGLHVIYLCAFCNQIIFKKLLFIDLNCIFDNIYSERLLQYLCPLVQSKILDFENRCSSSLSSLISIHWALSELAELPWDPSLNMLKDCRVPERPNISFPPSPQYSWTHA